MVDEQNIIKEKAALDYIADLRTARIREVNNKAKTYLQVTTGALVLSVSFLTISGFENITSIFYLVLSWVFLITAIVFDLISYLTVDLSFAQREDDTRKWIKEGMPNNKMPQEKTVWGTVTRLINLFGALMTIAGLVLLVLFGILNINNMDDTNSKVQGNNSDESTQKHAEPTISAPSLEDRLPASKPTSTPENAPKNED